MLYCLQPGFYHVLMYAWRGAWCRARVTFKKHSILLLGGVIIFYSVIRLTINPLHHLVCLKNFMRGRHKWLIPWNDAQLAATSASSGLSARDGVTDVKGM